MLFSLIIRYSRTLQWSAISFQFVAKDVQAPQQCGRVVRENIFFHQAGDRGRKRSKGCEDPPSCSRRWKHCVVVVAVRLQSVVDCKLEVL